MQLSDVRIASVESSFLIGAWAIKKPMLPPVYDLPVLPEKVLQGLLDVQDLHRLEGHTVGEACEGITRYPLYPFEAGQQPWAIELYDISLPYSAQVPEGQTKLFVVTEGVAQVKVDAQIKELQPGQSVRIYAGSTFSLLPANSGCRFLSLTMRLAQQQRGSPEETAAIFADGQMPEVPSTVGELDKKHFPEICLNGANAAYDLIEGKTVRGRYNVSILDIVCAKKHYHEQETERRIVLGGNLEVELDSKQYPLTAGQMCRISPMVVHRFKSKDPLSPTRLFAINIPAYDPANVKLAE